jgi:hypothetical protein
MMNSRVPAPTQAQLDSRRRIPTVKPAKMNIPEFDGRDADLWIQTVARTHLEQRTEVAVSYLQGEAMGERH